MFINDQDIKVYVKTWFFVMSTIAMDKDNDFCNYAYDVAP